MKKIFSLILCLVFAVLAISCGKSVDPDDPYNHNVNVGKLGKYEQTIELESALSYYLSSALPEGQTETDNIWTRNFLNDLGIKLKYRFAAPNNLYTEKLNADIGTGNIPDMFTVDVNQLPGLIEADLLYTDMAPIFEKYATDRTKELLGWNEGGIDSPTFGMAVSNGKLKAIPFTSSDVDTAEVMYLRKDWLDHLGLEIPKNIDEFEYVLRKFVHGDPDGNGQNDTYGLVGCNTLFKHAASLSGIFNAFGAYPEIWVDDGNGGLDFGFYQSNMKAPLEKLAKWYAEGLIFSELSRDSQSASVLISSGKAGIWFGNMTAPLWPLQTPVQNNFNADWVACPIPTAQKDASANWIPAKTSLANSIFRYHVVKKGCKNPEALVLMINYYVEMYYGENPKFDDYFNMQTFAPFGVEPREGHQKNLAAVNTAMSSGVTEGMSPEQKIYYDNIRAFVDKGKKITSRDDYKQWSYYRIFYTDQDRPDFEGYSSQSVLKYYLDNDLVVREKWLKLDTPTMATDRKEVERKLRTLLLDIITGKKDISEFDKQIANFRRGPAGQIIREVNEIYKKGN